MKIKIISLLVLIAVGNISFAQSIIWQTDGTVFEAKSTKIDSGFVEIVKKNGKTKFLDTADVFAIISGVDTMFLYSNPDYPLEKAKMFVKGQIDGKKYNNYFVYTGAFIFSTGTTIGLRYTPIPDFLSPLFSAIYTACFSKVVTKSKVCKIPEELQKNEDYIAGYKLSASKKKILNTSIYSVIGLITGYAVITIISLSEQ